MNYKRKFAKRYPRVNNFLIGAGRALQTANKAYQIATTVAAMINPEVKTFQIGFDGADLGGTAIHSLVTPALGDSHGDRTGNSIALKSILAKFQIYWHTASTPAAGVRVMVVMDRNEEDAMWSDLGELLYDIKLVGLKNHKNRKRFEVLYDRVFKPSFEGTTVNQTTVIRSLYFRKQFYYKDRKGTPRNTHLEFNDENSYGKNMVYIIFISETGNSYMPYINLTSEAKFVDN